MIKRNLKLLFMHQGFVRYLNNTSWMMVEQLLRIVAGLFVGIWVARYLGPEQFGIFSYAIAFSAIFGVVAKLGLDDLIVRELVNSPRELDVFLGTAFWLKIFGAIIVIGVLVCLLPFTSNDKSTNLFILIITLGLVFQSFEVVEFYFHSQVQSKIVSLCKVVQLALSSSIKVYLVLIDADLFWFILVVFIDSISLAFSYFVAYRVRGNSLFYKCFSIDIAKKLLNDSWPLIFSALGIIVYMRIDQIMIKEILGGREVGVYSASVRLAESFYFLPGLICASLMPAILNAKKNSAFLYQQRFQHLYTLMLWLAIAIALPVSLLSDWLISLFFGPAYQEAGSVLKINIWSSVFVFLGIASGKWFLVENKQLLSLLRVFSGVVVNIILNLLLIPKYGITGAAISTLISQAMATYFFDFFNKKTRFMFFMKTRAIFFNVF